MMMEAHVCVCVCGYITFPSSSEHSVKEEIQEESGRDHAHYDEHNMDKGIGIPVKASLRL